MPTYNTIEEMILATADAVRPPERISVSEAAERYHIVKNPGQHEGPFSLDKTPYLREPMDVLTSLDYREMIFVGPARTGKSAMMINWLCHTAITDPADMMVVHMATHTARDWSQADLAKALRNSPELKKRVMPGRQNDNVFDKQFLSGMRLLVTWPTITNLSGKTIPRLWLMDYDRMPQDIDKEGNPFALAAKRAQTFKRYGMCAAEASPGFDVRDPKWMSNDPHEAPPVGDEKGGGILSLYNQGDRRRWYWACPACESAFQPQFKLLQWPNLDSKDIMEMAEQTVMVCPHCGGWMEPSQQRHLNRGGKWVKSGQIWHPATDSITGTPIRSDRASFWMFGPAAGFTDWKELVKKHLNALDNYEKTGDEGPLRTTANVDKGEPYAPKAFEGARLPETLKARAEDWGGHNENGEPYVAERIRFLVATIDVQAGGRPSFVVHVFGVADGFDIFHIDMFKITKSERLNEVGEREGLDPAAHPEDWDLLVSQVLEKSYPLNDGSGRRMAVKIAACDSGGADGVTANAYDFYRRLRSNGQADRFHLVKGAPSRTETAPIRITYPNSQQKDKFAIARGDVPVWLINSNIVKDQVNNMLGRDEPGGQIHFPRWAQDWLYSQLTTEIRDPAKGWINPSRRRNEAFDLLAYCVAICDHPDIRIRFIDWSNPPIWAAPWDENPLVFGGETERPVIEGEKKRLSLAELGAALG